MTTLPSSGVDPTVVAAVRHAHLRLLGGRPEEHWARTLVERGVRPEFYDWVEAVAALAGDATHAARLTRSLIIGAEQAIGDGARLDEAVPWLIVLAGCPDQTSAFRCQEILEYGALIDSEWRGLPSEVAALSWAAGVTPAEARAECWISAAREVAEEMRTLATLRGFRLVEAPVLPGGDAVIDAGSVAETA